jgi:hypothetical protein
MCRLRHSSEDEMVALFLGTELSSDRFGAELRALLEGDGVPERVVTTPTSAVPSRTTCAGGC